MVEPEMAYATLEDATDLAEALVVSIVERVLDRRRRELEVLERDTAPLERVRSPFARIAYDEAVEILQSRGLPFEWGGDFGGPDETALAEHFDRPVAVQRFPAAIKAFYMKPDADRPELSLSVDVLAPEGYGEIVGGGERLDDYELLLDGFANTTCRARRSSGTWTSDGTGACRTQVSAWAWSASSRGFAGWSTSARPFRTRACSIA